MATETKEKTESTVEASAKCVALIQRIDKNSAEGASLKIQLSQVAIAEASRCGYDENETRKMLALSWREARGFKSSDETLQASFDQMSRPDVSKIMRLAYPVEEATIDGKAVKPASELKQAISHNEKAGASRSRIGENKLLEIARGNLSFADAKAGKAKIRAARTSGPVTGAGAPSASEQFHNAVAGLIGQYKVLSIAEIEKIFAQIVAERTQQKAA